MVRYIIILGSVLAVAVVVWVTIVLLNRSQGPKGEVAPKASQSVKAPTPAPAPAPQPSTPVVNIPAPVVSDFDPDRAFEDGELVIVDPPANFDEAIIPLGFRVIENVPLGNLSMRVVRLRIPSGMTVPSARRRLLGRFPGLTIDANHQFDESQSQTRPRRDSRRNTRRSGSGSSGSARSARSRPAITSLAQAAIGWKDVPATCGAGVRLGQIDSAVDLNHPALRGQRVTYRSFHNPKRRPGPAEHGTSVAAMLVGKPAGKGFGGLLPGAELVAANMFELDKIGKKVGNVVALLKALDWMVQQNVHAVNLSIAGSNNKAVKKAFDAARRKGLVMVAAAGNWGREDKPAYPAAYRDVIAVTAVGPYRGIYNKANRGSYVEFAAPGVRMWTAVPGGGGKYQSGTSFATPYLTALFGLEISKGAKKDPDTLRGLVRAGIADLGAPGKDNVFGWGFVQKQPSC